MEKELFHHIRLERTANGILRIVWPERDHKSIDFTLYLGPTPDTLNPLSRSDLVENGRHVEMKNLDPEQRYYAEMVSKGIGSGVFGERRVACEGTFNFRDLGGYLTADGRKIKWGKVFRSDGFSGLSEKGLRQLEKTGTRHIIDLRTADEVKSSPDKVPVDSSISYDHFPVKHGEFNFNHAMERLKQGDAEWLSEAYMVKGYINSLENYGPIWGKALKTIAGENGRPAVYHCTGGKDRTGTLSALLLLSLGVPAHTIIADHQLSNVFIADMLPFVFERVKSYGLDPTQVEPYFTAPVKGISALLSHIEMNYGDIKNYLAAQCGVTAEVVETLQRDLLLT